MVHRNDPSRACSVLPRRISVAVVMLAAVAVAPLRPGPAAGQTAGAEVDERTRQRARDHYRRGRQLFQRDRPAEALAELEASYALMPHWATSNGLALCEEKLGRSDAALRLYERAVREGGAEIPADQFAQIQDRIGALRRELGVARLTVISSPPGAALAVSGIDVGRTPFDGDVLAGSHSIVVRMEGYEQVERSVALGAAEARTVEIALVPVRTAAHAPRPGRLDVTSRPAGAAVSVDGRQVGTTPLRGIDLEPGERAIRVEAGPERTWEDRVAVSAGSTVRLDVALPGEGLPQGWFWAVAGTAAATAVGSLAAGAYAWGLQSEYDGADPARQDEIRPSGEAAMIAGDALLGVAGAAAIGALVLFFFTDFGESEPAVDITVVPTPEDVAHGIAGLLPTSSL